MSPSLPLAHFDHLYQQHRDPWQVRQRWYEQRKQALLLACLPRARYQRAFEPACGTGALTLALAERCDAVWAVDGSSVAVGIARQHTAGSANIHVEQKRLPHDWPENPFDLVILSEWLYYLSDSDLATTIRRCRDSLSSEGTLIACHWRPGFAERVQTTENVHAALHEGLAWPRLLRHEEHDFLLDIWSPCPASVAQREGIA